MKNIIIFLMVNLFGLATAESVNAEYISLRGIDWSMSQDEQVAELENRGLKCVQEPGWDANVSPAQTINLKAMPMCFVEEGPNANVETLRDEFAQWSGYCPTVQSPYNTCTNHPFRKLRDRLVRVRFQEGGRIIFQCEYFESCAYSIAEVVRQLQRQVINTDFRKPTEDSWAVCANGEEGDSVCVHLHSQAIWLIQDPDEGSIQF